MHPCAGTCAQAVELADALTPALERELTPRQAASCRYTLAFVHSARAISKQQAISGPRPAACWSA